MKSIKLILCLIFIFSLSGCSFSLGSKSNESVETTGKSIEFNKDGKSVINKLTKKETSNSLSLSYEQLDGTNYQDFYIKGDTDDEVTLNVDVTTISGSIDIYIYKSSDDKNPIYKKLNVKSSNFDISLPNCGGYTMKIKGLEHNGGYKLIW